MFTDRETEIAPSNVHALSLYSNFGANVRVYVSFDEVPPQCIVDLVEAGVLDAAPARLFAFDEIRHVHELLDAEAVGGKMGVLA